MSLSVWVLYGQARIHPTLGPYGFGIWAPHRSFMGLSVWDPYDVHLII